MRLTLVFGLLLGLSSATHAEDQITIAVKGMHCGSCVKTLNKKVCKEQSLENCEVTLTNKKDEMGQITFSKKEGLDLTKIKAIIEDAGYAVK